VYLFLHFIMILMYDFLQHVALLSKISKGKFKRRFSGSGAVH
jgi:hypothetical protein